MEKEIPAGTGTGGREPETSAWKRARDGKQTRDQLDGQGDREQGVSWVGGGMN